MSADVQTNIFVDTNVFVYARDASEPTKQTIAADWIRELWLERRGRTSVQVLNEFYVTVTRKLVPGMSRDEAWDDIQALMAWDPHPLDRGAMLRAREIERRYQLSWWDSMVVAAAELQECALLLTEDLQHGLACGSVRICNPFEAQVDETTPAYATRWEPVPRHRAPGRPRVRRPAQG
jgi:predicted nucleic acid-binding protein